MTMSTSDTLLGHNAPARGPCPQYRTAMNMMLGGLIAIILVVLCVGFGLAVRSIVDDVLGSNDPDRRRPRRDE